MQRCQAYVEFIFNLQLRNPYYNHPILNDFEDVFPKEIPRFPPKWEIYFIINLTPGEALVSRASMLHELSKVGGVKDAIPGINGQIYLDKCVSMGSTYFIFEK